jgi:2-oxoglutarate ferredoxin oxidoreductase subunit delta
VDIVIDERLCKSCGICIELCPKDVLAAVPPLLKAAVRDAASCTGCGLCQMLCPDWCISLPPRLEASV